MADLRLIDSCITQLKAQGPSRTCNESKEEEKKIGITFGTASDACRGGRWRTPPLHQQPDVNYFQVFDKVDFPCTVSPGEDTVQGKSIEG